MSPVRSSSISSSEKRGLKRFYLGLGAPLALCVLYALFATLLLQRSGEYWPLEEIYTKQSKTHGYVGSALSQRSWHYRQLVYKKTNPAVITLGSSRVLGFRQEDFSAPFVNMGGTGGLDEVLETAEAILTGHKPDLVILGVDFWWLHPQAEIDAGARTPADAQITASDLFQPLQWLLTGKLSQRNVMDILSGATPDIGIAAIAYKDGDDLAGAHYYTSTVTGAKPTEDAKFAANLKKIRNGEKKYAHGAEMSETQWVKLVALLDKLQAAQVPVIVFVPPLASPLYHQMDEQKSHAYADIFRQRLGAEAQKRHIPFFDYHRGGPAGTSDCEFVDGHHGGHVVYERMLLDMATAEESLRARLNLAAIGWNIQRYGGQASLRDDEVDFLQLGCKKPSIPPAR